MARLGGVAQPEPAIFTPMVRPRILQRIDAAAQYPIILILAPAGYGKSVAVSQWLTTQSRAHVRFNAQAEHNTLLGFARGLAEAFSDALPAMRNTVATAHQNSASSETPGIEMARWMASHLESFEGLIVIDDFHRATDDVHVSRFIATLVGQSTPRIQWLLSTRSTLDLPVASWLAYRHLDFLIGERELTFNEEEARTLSVPAGISETDLHAVMNVTQGWPVALGFALRDSLSAYGAAGIASATREMLFQFLAEQVYSELSSEERELMHFVAYLPRVEVSLLNAAGFEASTPLLERIRRRATFLVLDESGSYRCHELFRDFLKSQLSRNDPLKAADLQLRSAQTLERVGDTAAALRMYTELQSDDAILRLLQARGFELIDKSHGDVVERAVAALPMAIRLTEPTILGLRAQREADAGRFDRAETLFRKAVDGAAAADLRSSLSIRLAVLLRNQGRRINDLLEPLTDAQPSSDLMGEITALLAVDYALASDGENAKRFMADAERYCSLSDSDEIRAKILLRLGVAGISINMPEEWIEKIVERALWSAQRSDTYSILARVYNVLGTISLFYRYDFLAVASCAHLAAEASRKGGDVFALQTSLGAEITSRFYYGKSSELEAALSTWRASTTSDALRSQTVGLDAQAALCAWRGEFTQALALMDRFAHLDYGYYQFDRILNTATHALYAAVGNRTDVARTLVTRASAMLKEYKPEHQYAQRLSNCASVICAIVEAMLGRYYVARRMLSIARSAAWAPLVTEIVSAIVDNGPEVETRVSTALSSLSEIRHNGILRTLEACLGDWIRAQKLTAKTMNLTSAERKVLIDLSQGLRAKDIAVATGRSVHTIRTLIQRAIEKLGCSGQRDALQTARERGLLRSNSTDA